jgi:plastocyanin
MRTRQLATCVLALAVLMIGVGCGSTAETDPTPVKTFKITPASGTRPAATATAATTAVTPTAAAATPGTTGTAATGSQEVALAAKASELKFDKNSVTVSAGSVKFTFDNQDSGIPHNLSVFKGSDASGTALGKTDIAAGPIKQTLTVELTAGSYYFQCDVHPATMNGKITVN